ncbi:uncharacterized protein [Macrobrachium rosenbergii]|uniref:uncharacterized protein n=1 Tax=Macrobrachium rosenbergii TaxID=79674 RepID=UPI0034D46070
MDMGKFKLIECMKEHMFSLYIFEEDLYRCGSHVQRMSEGKVSVYTSPTVLKFSMKEPFELVAIDCVTLPVTARRSVGVIVMVDHKSRCVSCAAVKNKTSENVARVVSMVLLLACVRKPARMLGDNGPEFVGRPFEQMMKEWGINHIATTPYMSSANGLAKRTIMTLSEM